MDNGFLDEKEVLWWEVLFNLTLDQLWFCSRPYFFLQVLCAYFMEYSLLFLCSLFHRKFCGAVVVFIGWAECPASKPHLKQISNYLKGRRLICFYIQLCLLSPKVLTIWLSFIKVMYLPIEQDGAKERPPIVIVLLILLLWFYCSFLIDSWICQSLIFFSSPYL